MSKPELDNLVTIGKLKAEPATRAEFNGLVDSARKRLADARNESLADESRFDLAYNAAHGEGRQNLFNKAFHCRQERARVLDEEMNCSAVALPANSCKWNFRQCIDKHCIAALASG